MRRPERTARREITTNRFLTYAEEDLVDRHGRPYTYYQVESHWDAVVIVPVTPVGTLVLERVYRHPYRDFLIEMPAGGIEPGEDPCEAARRELEEETGYRAGRLTHLGRCEALPGLLRMRLHVVLADRLESGGHIRHEAMEILEVLTLTVEQAWEHARGETVSSFLALGLLYYDRWCRTSPSSGSAP